MPARRKSGGTRRIGGMVDEGTGGIMGNFGGARRRSRSSRRTRRRRGRTRSRKAGCNQLIGPGGNKGKCKTHKKGF